MTIIQLQTRDQESARERGSFGVISLILSWNLVVVNRPEDGSFLCRL